MGDWINCPGCGLKHSRRPDGLCPKCKQSVDGPAMPTDGADIPARHLILLDPGSTPRLRARTPLKAMLLGGEPLDGPRHLWWNFVASSRERIEQAKVDWEAGRFGLIPGDDVERIPLPER